jgi:intracellular multiplication protein IcmE
VDEKKKTGVIGFLGKAGNKKLLIFSGFVVLVSLVWSVVGFNKKEKTEISHIRSPADAGDNVSGNNMTSEYLRIRDAKTAQDVANAERNGGSVTAPIRPVESINSAMPSSLADGLNEKAPESPRQPVSTPAPPPATLHPPVTRATPDRQETTPVYHEPAMTQQQAQLAAQREAQLVQAMQQQMSRIAPTNPVKAEVISFQNSGNQIGGRAGTNGNGGGMSGEASKVNNVADNSTKPAPAASSGQPHGRFGMPAPGTIFYSRILGEVNSDTPGPVLAEVLQGPFVNSRLLGSFKSTPNGVVLSFSTMTVPYKDEDGNPQTEVMNIKAVAVDTTHLGTAIASDINNHMLLNLGMAFGTAFLQGLGMAAQESGSYAAMGPYGTTIANPVLSVPGEAMMAVGSGAATAGQIFQNIYGNKPPTITVNADTPFGLLFLGQGS